MVLVELDHGELLLKRASALLLDSDAIIHILLISALVLTGSIDHMSIVGAVLLRISLVSRRWICQCHLSMRFICVAAIYITVPVAIHNLIPIHED